MTLPRLFLMSWNVRVRNDLLRRMRALAIARHWTLQYTHQRLLELGLLELEDEERKRA